MPHSSQDFNLNQDSVEKQLRTNRDLIKKHESVAMSLPSMSHTSIILATKTDRSQKLYLLYQSPQNTDICRVFIRTHNRHLILTQLQHRNLSFHFTDFVLQRETTLPENRNRFTTLLWLNMFRHWTKIQRCTVFIIRNTQPLIELSINDFNSRRNICVIFITIELIVLTSMKHEYTETVGRLSLYISIENIMGIIPVLIAHVVRS